MFSLMPETLAQHSGSNARHQFSVCPAGSCLSPAPFDEAM